MPVKGIIGKIAGAVSGLWANKATQSTDTQKSIAAPMTDCFEVSSLFLAMHSASKAPGMMQRTIGTATIVNYNFWVRIHVRVGVRIGLNLYTTSRPYRNIRIAELLDHILSSDGCNCTSRTLPESITHEEEHKITELAPCKWAYSSLVF